LSSSTGAIGGLIVVTHTPNDTAVGNLYPLASLLAGDQAADLGDANSPYGGLGRNGAQKTPEAVQLKLLPVGSAYALTAGRIHNLEASQFVHNHSDITGPEGRPGARLRHSRDLTRTRQPVTSPLPREFAG
jgi:hypothetical protein